MPFFLQLLVTAVAVLGVSARITRLIGADKITAPLRAKLTVWTKSTKASDFLVCPWCTGFWVSAAATYLAWLINGWPFADAQHAALAISMVFSTSYAIGLLAEFESAE